MMTVIITLLQMLSSLSGVVQGQEWQLEDDGDLGEHFRGMFHLLHTTLGSRSQKISSNEPTFTFIITLKLFDAKIFQSQRPAIPAVTKMLLFCMTETRQNCRTMDNIFCQQFSIHYLPC